MTEPTIDDARAVLRKHGLPFDSIIAIPHEGVANSVFLAGSVAIRINRSSKYAAEMLREKVFVPIALATGVLAPKLLVFDDERDIIDAPTTIYERLPGVTASRVELKPSFYDQLGAQIALLHTHARATIEAETMLDHPNNSNGIAYLRDAYLVGKLTLEELVLLERWFNHLLTEFQKDVPRVFLHNDLHLGNLLASEDGSNLIGILDWSDAAWADPALEFHYLPVNALPMAVTSYRIHRPSADDKLEARALFEAATNAIIRLKKGDPSRYQILLEFIDSDPGGEWQQWLPKH
jgi:hygromycin-B 7''-O-kinase